MELWYKSKSNPKPFPQVMHDYIGFSVVGGMGSVLGDVPVIVIFVAPNSCAAKAGVKVWGLQGGASRYGDCRVERQGMGT